MRRTPAAAPWGWRPSQRWTASAVIGFEELGEALDGGGLEDYDERDVLVEGIAEAVDDAETGEGIAADLKEIVMDADFLDTEHGLPDISNLALQSGERRGGDFVGDEGSARRRGEGLAVGYGRGREGFAVELAVGEQRQDGKDHESRRNHGGRQESGEGWESVEGARAREAAATGSFPEAKSVS